jgi:hypothetical protein
VYGGRVRAFVLAVALAGCASMEPASNLPPRRPWSEPREQLDKGDIVYGMHQVQPAVGLCFDRYRQVGMFSVAFTVAGSGRITSVSVRGPHVETNDCVGQAVATATFPPFSGAPQSIVYPFILR